jgi:hypothetical protein
MLQYSSSPICFQFNRVGNGNYDISSKKHAFWIFKNQEMYLFTTRTLHFSPNIWIIFCDAVPLWMCLALVASWINFQQKILTLGVYSCYLSECLTSENTVQYIVFSFANSKNDWLMRTAESLVLRSPLKKYMHYCTWTMELCVSTWMGDRLGIRSVVDLFNN